MVLSVTVDSVVILEGGDIGRDEVRDEEPLEVRRRLELLSRLEALESFFECLDLRLALSPLSESFPARLPHGF